MSDNQLATQQRPSAIGAMAARLNVDPTKLLSTLKNTVFKNASDEEMMALAIVANSYGLNPFTKEIYAFPAKGGGIVPVVSVDGWVRIINEHPQMDGLDFEFGHKDDGALESCTAVIYRKDRSRPVRVTEYLSECRRPTEPWKMEHRMLRHKALIQCGRVAFGFAGLMEEDEAEGLKMANVTSVTTVVEPPPSTPPTKPKAIKAPAEKPADPAPEAEKEQPAPENAEAGEQPLEPAADQKKDFTAAEYLLQLREALEAAELPEASFVKWAREHKHCGPGVKFCSEFREAKTRQFVENFAAYLETARTWLAEQK